MASCKHYYAVQEFFVFLGSIALTFDGLLSFVVMPNDDDFERT